MNASGLLAVGCGAALGAWLRWGLSLGLNAILPALPLGTLAANLIGGYLMGLAMGAIEHYQALPPPLRLLMTTGFLGGLTTFSTFSAETTALLLKQQYGWVLAMLMAHVAGSVAMTLLGIASFSALRP